MKYRREIDGLRAVAVLPVIFFHAGFKAFSGGFVGVDIFFVISGYLITTIILAEKEKNSFSLVTFYERRARRILPALFFVMVCCFPFAWLWLSSEQLSEFSQSLIAVSGFSSNLLFWNESGYFATASELKPLLHTWSLAVEEQYYIIFPLFLMFVWKLRKRWIFGSLMLIALASLALAQWGAYNAPSATFFLLPARCWELAIGALIAFYFLYKKHHVDFITSNQVANELFGLLGIGLICYSIFAFDKTTPFPSFYALIPTVGTGLIIVFTNARTFVGRFLGTKVMVGVGLISYSTYLWHQPLFVFARHRSFTDLSVTMLLTLSFLSLILAYFSWKYVEIPFRNKERINRKRIFVFAVSGSVAFILFGMIGYLNNGFDQRLSVEQRFILSFKYNKVERSDYYREGTCFLKPDQSHNEFSRECVSKDPSAVVMLWGDSHAAALSYGLRAKVNNVIQYNASGCPPIKGLNVKLRPYCKSVNEFVLGEIEKFQPESLIMHADWSQYGDQNSLSKIMKTIESVSKISPKTKMTVIGNVPQWPKGLPEYLVGKDVSMFEALSLPMNDEKYNDLITVDEKIKTVATSNNVEFISPIEELCDGNNCPVIIRSADGFALTARDYGHMTKEGSVLLMEKLLAKSETLQKSGNLPIKTIVEDSL